jgi:ADP-ribosylglycohydrolase
MNWARAGQDADQMADGLSRWSGYMLNRALDDIRPGYRRTEKVRCSVPEAIACALQTNSVKDAVRNAVSLGGDSDTMAAVAGSIAEAMHGMAPALAAQGWGYLLDDMRRVLTNLYRVVPELG